MMGKIFITSSGYDPENGKHIKDPYLGPNPSLGACHPDIRRKVRPGDWIFTISGKVPGLAQFIMGGFEVAERIHAKDAFQRFPEQRLRRRPDGQLTGNIIVTAIGAQHPLDRHPTKTFSRRVENYVVGRNLLSIHTPSAISRSRNETMSVLRNLLDRDGARPIDLVTRGGRELTEAQVRYLIEWLATMSAYDLTA